MVELLERIVAELESGRALALLTVSDQSGSAPRGAGSMMLVGETEQLPEIIWGTIGGGLLENMAVTASREIICRDAPSVLDFNLSGELAANSDMICGGTLQVLVEPLTIQDCSLFQEVDTRIKSGSSVYVACSLSRHDRWILDRSGPYALPQSNPDCSLLLAACQNSVHSQSVQTITGQFDSYFISKWEQRPLFVLVGAGHVSRPTARLASSIAYSVVVLDDRDEFANLERFPNAESRVLPDLHNCFSGLSLNDQSVIVIVTRGHIHDACALEQALQTQAGYIGMIGSHTKRDTIYAAMREKGFSSDQLAAVHCPIGLDIGAETPEEIAVSIVAEVILHKRGTKGL